MIFGKADKNSNASICYTGLFDGFSFTACILQHFFYA
jgi:hypothetical protein